jgi:hypothetical protein
MKSPGKSAQSFSYIHNARPDIYQDERIRVGFGGIDHDTLLMHAEPRQQAGLYNKSVKKGI